LHLDFSRIFCAPSLPRQTINLKRDKRPAPPHATEAAAVEMTAGGFVAERFATEQITRWVTASSPTREVSLLKTQSARTETQGADLRSLLTPASNGQGKSGSVVTAITPQ
jgi:hypothetical protein